MSLAPPVNYFTSFAEEAESDIYDTDISEKKVKLFTWTPDPSRYPTSKPHEQYKIILQLILLQSHKVFSTFAFTPELNDNGNIHIHGWYVIKDKVKYHKYYLPKMKGFGYVKIDNCNSKKALEDYYKKDIELMNEMMYEYDLPIPLTHVNIKAYLDEKIPKRLKLFPHKKQHKLTRRVFGGKQMQLKYITDEEEPFLVHPQGNYNPDYNCVPDPPNVLTLMEIESYLKDTPCVEI